MNYLSCAAFAAAALLGATSLVHAADLTLPTVEDRAQTIDWSGFYAGASVGYGSGVSTREFTGLPFTAAEDDLSGALAGVQAGYNWQVGSLLLGVEGNIDWTKLATDGGPDALPRDVNWMGSLRARAGVAFDRYAIYGTAGVAFADSTLTSLADEAVSNQHRGWTAGVGVEALLTDQMSVRLEYAHYAFDTQAYDYTDPADFTLDSGFSTDIVKIGANFRF